MRIAHLSDLHLSRENRRRNIRSTRRLLEYVRRLAVDHLVITGDILADAVEGDMRCARKVLSSFDLLHPGRLTVVPGNHDIFGGVHHAEDILTFPRRCKGTDYAGKLAEFRLWFREAYEGAITAGDAGGMPFAKVVDGLLLVGLNSVAPYSPLQNPLGSNGRISDEQRAHADRLLSAPEFRKLMKVVLIHHHFHKLDTAPPGAMQTVWGAVERHTMKLRGKKNLLNLFQAHGVRLVLHGHHHRNMDYHRRGIRFLNGGGSVLGGGNDLVSLNVIEIREGRVSVEMHRLPVLPEQRTAGGPLVAPATELPQAA